MRWNRSQAGPDHLFQDSDGRGQGPAIGQLFLDLFEGQGVAVVHQFLVQVAVNVLEPAVERIVRIVVLVALDSPATHDPPQALVRPSRPRLVVFGPTGSPRTPKVCRPAGRQFREIDSMSAARTRKVSW